MRYDQVNTTLSISKGTTANRGQTRLPQISLQTFVSIWKPPMTEEFSSSKILALDPHVTGPWFKIVVVTETEVLAATMKKKRHTDVLRMLESGFDPYEILKSNAPMESPVRVAPHSDIQALEWSDGVLGENKLHLPSFLKVYYFNHTKGKLKKFRVYFHNTDSRDYIVRAIKPLLGQWEEKQAPSTIWQTGYPAFVAFLLLFVIFCLRATHRFFMYGPKVSDFIANFDAYFFPVLRLSFGRDFPLIIMMLFPVLIWWFISCFNPPIRTIIRPVGKDS